MCNSKMQGHKVVAVLPVDEEAFEFVIEDFEDDVSIALRRHEVVSWVVWDTGETVALCVVDKPDREVEVKMSCCLASRKGAYYPIREDQIRRAALKRWQAEPFSVVNMIPFQPSSPVWPFA